MIDILIPTYGRAPKIAPVMRNIEENTTIPHQVHFILEKDDYKSIERCRRFNYNYIFNQKRNYVGSINTGYKMTSNPFIFCGADDLEFRKGWDIEAIKLMEDRNIGIVGVNDSFPVTKTKMHACHFLVRREYIEKQSGVYDEPNVIYSNSYIHLNCDIETIQTAIRRGAWAFAENSWVEHLHWFINKAIPMDTTYARAMSCLDPDGKTFQLRRKKFEMYMWEFMWKKQLVKVGTKTDNILSIVMPVYNALFHTQMTLASLYASSFYKFELIIIDDNSNQETKDYLKTWVGKPNVKVIFNEKNKLTNHNWIKGIEEASNPYVAIINNDITFSQYWDYHLVDALKGDVWVSSPMQTDALVKIPYGNCDRSGGIDVRGACFMAKKKVFEAVGAFPKQLKFWYGDSWLAWVVPTIYNKKTCFVKDAVIKHYGSQSTFTHKLKDGERYPLNDIIKKDREEYTKLLAPFTKIEYKIDGSIKSMTNISV